MSRNRKQLSSLALLLVAANYAGAEEPPDIVHNPFARPPSEVTFSPRDSTDRNVRANQLDLSATMVGTTIRLANVGGRLLHPGDEIAGYTLIHVAEDHAVFAREGRRLTVYVKPQEESENGQSDE